MRKKRKFSVRARIAFIGLSCWLIPFLVFTAMVGYYIFSDQMGKRVERQREMVRYNTQISAERLNAAVSASRDASYEGELKEQWEKIDKAFPDRKHNFYVLNESVSYLTKKYRHNMEFQSVFFWYEEAPEELNAAVYNGTAGGNYRQVQTFWKHDFEKVREYAQELDNSTGFLMTGNKLYLVRNMKDGHFNTFATLVMSLNVRYLFGSLMQLGMEDQVIVQVNDVCFGLDKEGAVSRQITENPAADEIGCRWENGILRIRDGHSESVYDLSVLARFPRKLVTEPIQGYLYVMIAMVIFLFPVMGFLYRELKKNISVPVEEMMAGAKKVEEGELGFLLAYEPASREFQYLVDSFNRMSERLKYQFDHIYQEELALRDAKIMALQSHINPHFLNNTLEIINWEARLQGNGKISKMIEALSVLLNAAMDRKRIPEIPLKEEMEYVDAYLYIMKERLGSRLHVLREIPDGLLRVRVPRLIMQPVIENAIEHGVIPCGEGTVTIAARKEGQYLYLEVCNDGEMKKAEKEKVKRLLDPDYNTSRESSGNLGIANVNQRLRILYGEPCGLTISNEQNGQICACLTILASDNAQ